MSGTQADPTALICRFERNFRPPLRLTTNVLSLREIISRKLPMISSIWSSSSAGPELRQVAARFYFTGPTCTQLIPKSGKLSRLSFLRL